MIRLSLAAVASALVLAACATQAPPSDEAATVVVVPSQYELGMSTAAELQAAGNVPAAIQRLISWLAIPESPRRRRRTFSMNSAC